MVIIAKKAITEFIEKYPRSAKVMLEWYLKTKESDWTNFADIKKESLERLIPSGMDYMYLILEEINTVL